jgi:hypothetical protein
MIVIHKGRTTKRDNYSNIPLWTKKVRLCVSPESERSDIHNASSLQGRQEATDHGRDSNTSNDLGLRGSKGTKHTNLDTEGAQVGEAAKTVRSDGVSSVRKGVFRCHQALEVEVGNKLVRDELGSQKTGNREDLFAGNADEEGEGVEDVSDDELESKLSDTETLSDPSQKAVNPRSKVLVSAIVPEVRWKVESLRRNKGDNSEHIGPMRVKIASVNTSYA